MLYVFAGFPRNNLNAGGLGKCLEEVECLVELEHDPSIQFRKEGVYTVSSSGAGEFLRHDDVVISPTLIQEGITWDWFPDNWAFGNMVSCHKTEACPEYKTVVHGTDLSLDEYLKESGPTQLADLKLENIHIRHEGWEEYEARWLPNTCPQENHIIHLTWFITTHRIPTEVYNKIGALIESEDTLDKTLYDEDDFSLKTIWNGEKAYLSK